MFEFLFVIGIVLAFYGYSVMKNPHVWGDQGRDEIRPENWNGYVAHNGQFMMYSGFFLAALAALDVIFTFASWLYCLILLGGLALLFYPLPVVTMVWPFRSSTELTVSPFSTM